MHLTRVIVNLTFKQYILPFIELVNDVLVVRKFNFNFRSVYNNVVLNISRPSIERDVKLHLMQNDVLSIHMGVLVK